MELVVDFPLLESLDLEVVEIHPLLSLRLSPLSSLLPLLLSHRLLLLLLDPLDRLDLALLRHDVLQK
jgi:hypothetical protein